MKKPKKILIVRTDRIGDVILSTPVVKNLRRAFPESHIAFMCRPYTKEILENNSYLNEVIVYDKYAKHKSTFSSILFCRYLRRKKFDLSLILHPTNRVHLLTFFAGIPVRVGWDRKLGFLLTKRIPHKKQEGKKHELQYSLDLLRALGIKDLTESPAIGQDTHAQNWIDDFLIKNSIDYKKDTVIGLGLGASCPSKIWPPEHFAQLARGLKEKLGAKIIVITEGTEKHLAQTFSNCFRDEFLDTSAALKPRHLWRGQKTPLSINPEPLDFTRDDSRSGEPVEPQTPAFRPGCVEWVDLTKKLSLKEISALLRRVSLFIGNDSGLIHIAWAQGVPVISLFGRNDPGLSPRRWKPLGKHSYFFHKDSGCTKCLAHNCKIGFLCLKSIRPSEVLDKAVQILTKQKKN